jgi:23S rRNA pseudouridine1911/1915/1917 synthase
LATMSREPIVVTVDEAGVGVRLDRFLVEQMPGMSRSRLSALVRAGAILVNNRTAKPSHPVALGDLIEIRVPEARPAEAQPQEIPLGLLYEDDDLAVLDKASGMVVHPGAGHDDGTVVNALLHRYGPLSTIGGVHRPGIVHRLDKETSGCLVVARNDFTHTVLARQFAGRQTRKVYLAVVQGIPTPSSGRIENQLARNPAHRLQMTVVAPGRGRLAVTDYEVIHRASGCSLVKCTLHTGRTHQIRVHLKHLGHPILGDETYARPARQPAAVPRLMLHAWQLGFTHPRTLEWIEPTSPIPPEFQPFLPATGGIE